MAEFNPAKFIREVRQEGSKVTWPTRRETTISSLMVLALATLAAIFFVLADMLISATIRWIIGM
ncbi:MAG: preprotein translocase subunit SecE [Ralstonia sp.]|jgi:preprotein translocase subunit SecE